jgi:hypothetical protein
VGGGLCCLAWFILEKGAEAPAMVRTGFPSLYQHQPAQLQALPLVQSRA